MHSSVGFVCFSRAFGGLEMTTLRLASQFAARGAKVHVVVPESSPMQQECVARCLPHTTLEPAFKYGDLRAALRLGRIFRQQCLDVALVFRSRDMHLAALAAYRSPGTRLFFYQQMQSGIGKKDHFHNWVFSRFVGWLTLTSTMRREVLQWTNMPPERVHVAYLGRDATSFQPSNELSSAARRALQLPARGLVAGVLGRLDRQKGQMEFLEAIAAIRTKIPKGTFLIAGDETKDDPGMREKLIARALALGISDRVRFLPPTNDVPSFLAALDVFLMPSYSETYGLVLIEAMAMGLPVISTNSGGVPELVRNGVDGLIVEPKNVPQLAEAIVTLARQPALRRRMRASARKRFLQTFREDQCIDRVVELIEKRPR
jgi:glycosyltransferase involved in cell wall biosynthesis